MNVSDLVSRLSAFPGTLEVCIFDEQDSDYVLRSVSDVLKCQRSSRPRSCLRIFDSAEFEEEFELDPASSIIALTCGGEKC